MSEEPSAQERAVHEERLEFSGVQAAPEEPPVPGRLISDELERQRELAEKAARIAAEEAARAKAAAAAADARAKLRAEADARAKAKAAAEAAAIVEVARARVKARLAEEAAEIDNAAESEALQAALVATEEGPIAPDIAGAASSTSAPAKLGDAAATAIDEKSIDDESIDRQSNVETEVLQLSPEMTTVEASPSMKTTEETAAEPITIEIKAAEQADVDAKANSPEPPASEAQGESDGQKYGQEDRQEILSEDLAPAILRRPGGALSKQRLPSPQPQLAAEKLEPILKGAAGDAPVKIETLSNQKLTLRVTASLWARPEIVAERRTGCAPIGPVVENAAAAEADLAPLADDELSHGRGLQSLSERLSDDPWTAMGGLQGDGLGPLLAETRSVVSRCTDCAGAGGFACIDCEGVGRRDCSPCDGTGQIDEGCPSCRRAVSGKEQGKVALDPKRALTFLMSQVSSGGAAGEAAERSVANASDQGEARRDCAECSGAGSRRVECANCAGAGERRCSGCSGTGRVTCAPCAGTGFLTEVFSGRARYERSLHIALSTGEADVAAPSGAIEAIRGAWDALTETRAFEPRLVGFQSSGFGAQAVFEAEITLTRLRAVIGARSPRTYMEFWSAGEPAMLLNPPKALDLLHRKAVDNARLATREGRRQVASALSDLSCGRAALRAAARRERDLPLGAFGPLASDAENARLLELARASHGSVGWREERHVWTAAALLAAPAGWLAAQALGEPASVAIQPITVAFSPAQAQTAPGVWETLGAVWSLLVATAPFATLWLLGGLVAAWAYRRTTLRTLGFARSRSAARVFLGSAPIMALCAALFAYGVGLTVGAPPAQEAAPGALGTVQVAAVAKETRKPPQQERLAATAAAKAPNLEPPATPPGRNLTASAFGGGAELAAFATLKPVDWEWRGDGVRAAVADRSGNATLVARCEANAIVFRLAGATGAATPTGAGFAEVAWKTERARLKARGVTLRRDRTGAMAPEWQASRPALRALRRDRNLQIDWSVNGETRRSTFRLVQSSDVLQRIINGC